MPLNTSLNLAGKPIVCSAAEGYSTFRRCGIDLLVVGDTRVGKRVRAEAAQLGWMRSLGGEGGLFVTVGRRPVEAAARSG